jgi:hypothetical protein
MKERIAVIFVFVIWVIFLTSLVLTNSIIYLKITAIIYALGHVADIIQKRIS